MRSHAERGNEEIITNGEFGKLLRTMSLRPFQTPCKDSTTRTTNRVRRSIATSSREARVGLGFQGKEVRMKKLLGRLALGFFSRRRSLVLPWLVVTVEGTESQHIYRV